MVLITLNVVFVPRFGYMACAWAGFAGYGTAMVLSYLVGQRKYPIAYPVREIGVYVLLAIVLFVGMTMANRHLSALPALGVNCLLFLVFAFYLCKRDFPLENIPFLGKYFKKHK